MFSGDDYAFQESLKQLATEYTPLTAEQEREVSDAGKIGKMRDQLANVLRKSVPNSCVMQMIDCKAFPKPVPVQCPKSVVQVANELVCQSSDVSVTDLVEKLQLSEEEISTISEATVDQASSQAWHDQRKARITASSFHAVKTMVKSIYLGKGSDTSKLVKKIIGLTPVVNTASVKHGISMEPHAKRSYRRIMQKTHKHIQIRDSGLVLCGSDPYIGASPDLIVTCKCHGKGLCEIKCPYSIRDQKPHMGNYNHLDEGNSLKKSSQYYTQIIGQMGVLGLEYCDFFVYTSHGSHLERIEFDKSCWDKLLADLKHFWCTYVAPELLHPLSESTDQNDDHVYSKDNSAVPLPVPPNLQLQSCKGPLTQSKVHL